jgi:hypothetical protein
MPKVLKYTLTMKGTTMKTTLTLLIALLLAPLATLTFGAEPNTSAVQSLDGDGWRIATDPKNEGREAKWFAAPREDAKPTKVPGTIQQTFPGYHGAAWYWTEFASPAATPGHRWRLCFGAVDYFAEVWLNGTRLGVHEGSDAPFEFDVSDALRVSGKNLLAVRVINPGHRPTDGFVVSKIPHSFKVGDGYDFGGNANSGGILLPVELRLVPTVHVADIFVRTDISNGDVRVQITAENLSKAPTECLLKVDVRSRDNGREVVQCAAAMKFMVPPGQSAQNLSLNVKQPRLWSPQEPNLYSAGIALEAAMPKGLRTVHRTGVRFGFRDFRVGADGYFRLNGKRLFLKSCHTVNNFPVAIGVAHTPELFTRDLLYAKGMGFDMVRFLGGPPFPEQLQFCDEIGLMVYSESRASWRLGDSPQMAERFDRSVSQMILRDRNHPCVTIWGLLNETGRKHVPQSQHAMAALPLVRSLDDTRLVLFNSGRFDGAFSNGSLCNPGSATWEYLWGGESPDNKEQYLLGDRHMYPWVPHTDQQIKLFQIVPLEEMVAPNVPRSDQQIKRLQDMISSGAMKPVFLSEYGIGSLVNPYRIMRLHDQNRTPEDAVDFAAYRKISERLTDDLKKYGMDCLFAFPEDLILASERMHARHRTLGYNAIRANPLICGYSLTGLIDSPAGEGLLTEWQELKQGTMDAMNDCLAPLRWCLFVEPMHAYAGRPFRIKAVMANDGVLDSGEYPVRLKIFGPQGVVWEKVSKLVIPAADSPDKIPLASPVLDEDVTVNGPAGVYTFAAELERGGAARGGRFEFYISRKEDFPRMTESVAVLGIPHDIQKWLKAHGVTVANWNEPAAKACRIILVGDNIGTDPTQATNTWRELAGRIATGDVAVFLTPSVFAEGTNSTQWLPLKNKGVCRGSRNWIYHREDVAKQHPVFEGLPAGGMLNWYYYLQVTPDLLFEGLDTPEDAVAAAFAPGDNHGNGYNSGLLTGMYRLGAGRFFVNTLRILKNVDTNPSADRLLLNMIRTAAELGKGPRTELPPDFETSLNEIGYGSR